MRGLLLAILLICLMPVSPIMSEPILSLEDNFNLLTQRMMNSLQRLEQQRMKIDSLEISLKQALDSSTLSQKQLKKLKKELAAALKVQQELEQTISMLRDKSEKVSSLLRESEETLNNNEDAHLADLKKVEKAHKSEIMAATIAGWLKFGGGIAIGAGIMLLVLLLK